MRVWDVPAGYLSRQRLLGEHRELHGLASILVHDKKGYSRHPETLRWAGCLSGLTRRHAWLVAEMQLRGYRDRTPLDDASGQARWPGVYVTDPGEQFALLREKYAGQETGRIELPRSSRVLWEQHRFSVLARDAAAARTIARRVARLGAAGGYDDLARELVERLREEPAAGAVHAALERMWACVRHLATPDDRRVAGGSSGEMLRRTQVLAMLSRDPRLLASTALSELAVFVPAAADRSA